MGNKIRINVRCRSSLNQLYYQGLCNGELWLENSSTGQSRLRGCLTKTHSHTRECTSVLTILLNKIIALHCLLPESASHWLPPTATPARFREGARPAGPLSTCHISPCMCPSPLCSQISLSGPSIIWVFAIRHFPVNYQQPKNQPWVFNAQTCTDFLTL